MPNIESVAMGVWVGVGGRYEDKRISGVSHFIEHLLFKGTKTRSAKDISQAIEGRGGYFNAFTQEESTCYYARISTEHMRSTFAILADMYLNPKFAAEDINKERGVIIEEIMMYKDQPQHLVQEILGELLWQDHALGRPLIGTTDTVGNVSRAAILKFKATKYVADNTVVVLAGKVDHDACVKHIGELLGHVRGARKPAYPRVTKQTAQKDVRVFAKDIEQTHIALGIRLFGRHDSRRYALKLLSIILGENMSSRLFQVVREKHGLAYSIHSSVQLFDETGVLDIQAGVDCDRISKAIELILSEVVKFKDKPVGAQRTAAGEGLRDRPASHRTREHKQPDDVGRRKPDELRSVHPARRSHPEDRSGLRKRHSPCRRRSPERQEPQRGDDYARRQRQTRRVDSQQDVGAGLSGCCRVRSFHRRHRKIDPYAKTIIFCVDQEHAEEMRLAINNLCPDLQDHRHCALGQLHARIQTDHRPRYARP